MNSPTAGTEVRALIGLADEIAPPEQTQPSDRRWHEAIARATSEALVGVIAELDSGHGDTSRQRKAMRESAIAEAQRKNAKDIIDTLHQLDRATSALNRGVLGLTIAGVLLAVVQVVLAFLDWYARR